MKRVFVLCEKCNRAMRARVDGDAKPQRTCDVCVSEEEPPPPICVDECNKPVRRKVQCAKP